VLCIDIFLVPLLLDNDISDFLSRQEKTIILTYLINHLQYPKDSIIITLPETPQNA
jgi:hypothetical protein